MTKLQQLYKRCEREKIETQLKDVSYIQTLMSKDEIKELTKGKL